MEDVKTAAVKTAAIRQIGESREGQLLATRSTTDDFGAFEMLLDSWNGAHRSSSAAALPSRLHEASRDAPDEPGVATSASRQVLEVISGESLRIAEEIAATRGRLNALEADLARARTREREAALSVLRELLARYDLQPSEILDPPRLALCQPSTTDPLLARDSSMPLGHASSAGEPDSRQWCGKGRHPKWLKQMLAEGRQLSEFSTPKPASSASSQSRAVQP